MKVAFTQAPVTSNPIQFRKYLRFHIQGWAYQFKALPFGLSTAPMEFTVIPKEVKLVGESQIPPGLSPTYTRTSKNVSATGLAGELREIRAGAQTRLRFCRLPVRPQVWSGPTDSGPGAEPSRENAETATPTGLPGPGILVLDRFTNSYRKVSSSRPTSYETIQTVVFPSRCLPLNMQQVAPAQNRLICHEVQQQVASVCVICTGSPGHSSGCTQSAMVGSRSIHLPTISHIGQSGGEVARVPMQENHSDCSGVAQHALVLGSSGHVQPNPTEPVQSAQPVDSHSIRSLTEI